MIEQRISKMKRYRLSGNQYAKPSLPLIFFLNIVRAGRPAILVANPM